MAHQKAVHENVRIAKNAIELEPDAPTAIRFRDFELAPVPAHAVFGKCASERLVAVTVAALHVERKLHRPIVWQVDFAKATVVEVRIGRTVRVSSLREVGKIRRAVPEIPRRVRRVTESETETAVETRPLAWRHSSRNWRILFGTGLGRHSARRAIDAGASSGRRARSHARGHASATKNIRYGGL